MKNNIENFSEWAKIGDGQGRMKIFANKGNQCPNFVQRKF